MHSTVGNNSWSAGKQTPLRLRTSAVYESLSLVPTLMQLNSCHKVTSYFFTIHFVPSI